MDFRSRRLCVNYCAFIFITAILFLGFRCCLPPPAAWLLSSSWRQGDEGTLTWACHLTPRVLTPKVSVPKLFQGLLYSSRSFLVLPSEEAFIFCFSCCLAFLLSWKLALILLPRLKHFGQPRWSFTCLLSQNCFFLCTLGCTQYSFPTFSDDLS